MAARSQPFSLRRSANPRFALSNVREESWESVNAQSASMGPESPLFPRSTTGDDPVRSIQNVADRVVLEMEAFCVLVDQWRERLKTLPKEDSQDARYDATIQLLEELHQIATVKASDLKGEHHARSGAFSKSWLDRIQRVEDRALRGSSVATSTWGDGTEVASLDPDSDLDKWQAEANTWELLRAIVDLEFQKPDEETKEQYRRARPINQFTPDAELWTTFNICDDSAREKKVILEWLERCARNGQTDFESIVERLEERAGGSGTWSHGWLHTREKIKHSKRNQSFGASFSFNTIVARNDAAQNLITELDPDAPSRQGKNLDKQDEHYERSMWLALYEALRRGMPWTEIRQWCTERNEGWRAASLGVAQELDRDSTRLNLSGSSTGALWRRMCYAASQTQSADKYERAVYGLLAGDVKSVEAVGHSFDDALYAHFNALLLQSFETWLEEEYPDRFEATMLQQFPRPILVSDRDDGKSDSIRVVNILVKDPKTAQEARKPLKVVQSSFLTHDFELLAAQVGLALAIKAQREGKGALIPVPQNPELLDDFFVPVSEDWDAVRVVVHAYIVYKELGLPIKPSRQVYIENTIAGYIDFLRSIEKFELIPTYATFLPTERQEEVLGIVLVEMKDEAKQLQMAELIGAAGIEIDLILSNQYIHAARMLGINLEDVECIKRFPIVENSVGRWAGARISSTFTLPSKLPEDEERLARSLEWFFKIPSYWDATFLAMTFSLRQLLCTGRFAAALAVTKRIPFKQLSKAKSAPYLGREMDIFEETAPAEDTLRRSTRHGSRPTTPSGEPPSKRERFLLRMLKAQSRTCLELQQLCLAIEALAKWREFEDQIAQLKEEDLTTKDFRRRVQEELETLSTAMEPLLHDLLTHIEDESEVELYASIRQAYLPDAILAYNGAITFAADFTGPETMLKSLALTNLLAAEENAQLTNAFLSAGRMTDLVSSLALSSQQLLRVNQRMAMAEDMLEKERVAQGKTPRIRRKKSGLKKRGWMGESLDIWDPNKAS
ncbi:hypothetical protein EJ06DRAFT_545684 [Trichodelitschia bisporula]|uniref:Nuclear pore complex protein n=1 Tax=Trichodelitschia bisporula TaxID=703511 RepID=A0A6G1IA67_9PEZI|nr:hypothetical protein EJ06DRAFT_545684 [Trichodelitschia bisporula]